MTLTTPLAALAVLVSMAAPCVAEPTIFPFPASLDCTRETDRATDCPDPATLDESESLLCIRRRGRAEPCKVVSRHTCGLVSQTPGALCDVDSLDVRARWRAEILLRALQGLERIAPSPTSVGQARYLLSDGPDAGAFRLRISARTLEPFVAEDGACFDADLAAVETQMGPVLDRPLSTIPASSREAVVAACNFALFCRLDAIGRADGARIDRLETVRDSTLCREAIGASRDTGDAVPSREVEIAAATLMRELPGFGGGGDMLAAAAAALRAPTLTLVDEPELALLYAGEAFASEGIDPSAFFLRELGKGNAVRGLTSQERGTLADALSGSGLNPDDRFYMLDLAAEACGPLRYAIGESRTRFQMRLGTRRLRVNASEAAVEIRVPQEDGLELRHTATGAAYLPRGENGRIWPVWFLGETRVCGSEAMRLDQCRLVPDRVLGVLSYGSPAFLETYTDHGLDCGGE